MTRGTPNDYTSGAETPVRFPTFRYQPPMANENTSSPPSHRGAWIIAGLVIALLVLHQDNWFWTDKRLVLGFIPIGLFWHACISLAASITWFLATRIAWPLDEVSSDSSSDQQEAAQ